MATLGFGGSIQTMTDRERSLVLGLVASFLAIVVGVTSFFVLDALGTISENNDQMAQALREIDAHGDEYRVRHSEQHSRMTVRPAPALQGYLEQVAGEVGIEIPESNERPAIPHGKQFVERAVDIKLRKVSLDQLIRFLSRIETGPYTIATTHMSVRTQYSDHTQMDVELTISTYDTAAPKPQPGGAATKGA